MKISETGKKRATLASKLGKLIMEIGYYNKFGYSFRIKDKNYNSIVLRADKVGKELLVLNGDNGNLNAYFLQPRFLIS